MPLDKHVEAFEGEAYTLATMNVGAMWDKLLGEFLGEWTRVNRQNLPTEEIEKEMLAYMENLSDNLEVDLSRKSSTVAYNQGRAAEMRTAYEENTTKFAIRSEVMDVKTCSECAKWDGLIVEIDSAEFFEYHPPAKCLGGDNCRGFYVAIPEKEAS